MNRIVSVLSLATVVAAVSASVFSATPFLPTRDVRLTTPDDVGILGTYYPVESSPAPAVLLIHSLGQGRTNWAAFAAALQQNGIAAFAIDLRGHGESTRRLTADGAQVVDYRAFTPKDFQDLLIDVNAAMTWLEEQPGINGDKIALIGAGLGANLALRYGTFREGIAGVVLLSPGINYKGIRTDDVVTKVGNLPLRIAVTEGAPFAFESAKRLIDLRKEAGHETVARELWVSTGNLQGIEMIAGVRGLSNRLVGWLKEVLLGAPPQPEPPSPAPAPSKSKRPPARK